MAITKLAISFLIIINPAYAFENIISHECLDPQAVFNTTTTVYHGATVEPSIAVNPCDKNEIIAAWQQDRISNGAALEIGIAYTKDGGLSWKKTRVPFQICEGGINQMV